MPAPALAPGGLMPRPGWLLGAAILCLPLLCFAVNVVALVAYGVDMPFMDDWRAYQTGEAGSLELGYLFQPANDTLFPIGLFLDSMSLRLLGGNSVAYQWLSLTLVLGSLLFLQWRLLRHVLHDRLVAACAFSATLFMLQPGSYWGLQDMAYHQAVPLVAVLLALHVVLVNRWHAWLSPALLLAIGTVSGMIYISGAFAMLALGGALLAAALLLRAPRIAPLARGGLWVTLIGVATSIPQLWVILVHQKGTHRPDAPMAFPTEIDFWFYLLGKVGRSLMLPMDRPVLSMAVVALALTVLAGVIIWSWRAGRAADAPGQLPAAEAVPVARAFVIVAALTAVVGVYLAMVSAGRTNLRPEGMDLQAIFSFAFHRFHFFWATLLWPWVLATLLLAVQRWRPSIARPAAVCISLVIILYCLAAGVFGHRAFYVSTAELRISGIKCIREHIEASRPILCESLLPVDLSQALRFAERVDASFARTLEVTRVTVLPINPDSHEPLPLAAADILGGSFAAPQAGTLTGMGLFLGNYAGLADGTLSLEACTALTCVGAAAPLEESADNDFFLLEFAQPLHTAAGEQVSFRMSVAGSTHPVAAWLYAGTEGSATISIRRGSTESALAGKTLRLSLHYPASQEGLPPAQ